MNVCGMSFSGWMDGFTHINIVLSGISGVLPIKLSVVSLALLCVCVLIQCTLYSFATYCDSSGAKSDCSGERWPTKYHIHL